VNLKETSTVGISGQLVAKALSWQAILLSGIQTLTAGPQLINNFQEPLLTVRSKKQGMSLSQLEIAP
jgi:hypothetical protein